MSAEGNQAGPVLPDVEAVLISMVSTFLQEVIQVLEGTSELAEQIKLVLADHQERIGYMAAMQKELAKSVESLKGLIARLPPASWSSFLSGITFDTNNSMVIIFGNTDLTALGLDADHPARPLILQIWQLHETYKNSLMRYRIGTQIFAKAGVIQVPH